jgi:hypothetical protein
MKIQKSIVTVATSHDTPDQPSCYCYQGKHYLQLFDCKNKSADKFIYKIYLFEKFFSGTRAFSRGSW